MFLLVRSRYSGAAAAIILGLAGTCGLRAADVPPALSTARGDFAGPMWDMDALGKAPAVNSAEPFRSDGLKAVFFEGVPYKGKPTRVFAWMGIPKVEPGKTVPGIVLVHGGGGTAFEV